jgi:hypothetical protein
VDSLRIFIIGLAGVITAVCLFKSILIFSAQQAGATSDPVWPGLVAAGVAGAISAGAYFLLA